MFARGLAHHLFLQVISESVVTPSVFRAVLADVLYRHFGLISVLFAPTPLFATFPLGVQTALVVVSFTWPRTCANPNCRVRLQWRACCRVPEALRIRVHTGVRVRSEVVRPLWACQDCGHKETTVMAVYNGVPLIGTFVAVAAASETVHGVIRAKLVEAGAATPDELTEEVLEDIKVRACLVRTTVGEVRGKPGSHDGFLQCSCASLYGFQSDPQTISDVRLPALHV